MRDTLHFEASPRYSFFGRHGKNRQTSIALGILGLLLIYMAWLVWQIAQAADATQALREKSQAVKTLLSIANSDKPNSGPIPIEDASKPTSVTTGNLTTEKRRMLNAVVQQLNIPWHDIFDQLERLTPQDVALLSIEPDGQRAIIKLQAEAKSLDTLLMYAASLQQQGVFGRLTYRKHDTNEQDSNKPDRLAFELELLTPARLKATAAAGTTASNQPVVSLTPKVQP